MIIKNLGPADHPLGLTRWIDEVPSQRERELIEQWRNQRKKEGAKKISLRIKIKKLVSFLLGKKFQNHRWRQTWRKL
jgi:hypothetical protein